MFCLKCLSEISFPSFQDVLREKELYIEQLLKERDLERAEVTRAASQADDAEQKLVAYKQEFEQVSKCIINFITFEVNK